MRPWSEDLHGLEGGQNKNRKRKEKTNTKKEKSPIKTNDPAVRR